MSEDVRVISKTVNIPLDNLHIRYIPMAKLERFYTGTEPMLLINSPHVELLRQYKELGFCWDVLLSGRYAQERRSRREDFGQKKWTEEYIKKHIKHRIAIYENMTKGWRFKKDEKPIMILEVPFWNTRYLFFDERIHGHEIWNGAGRCAAAHVLGWKEIPAVWVEDTRPGTKECLIQEYLSKPEPYKP